MNIHDKLTMWLRERSYTALLGWPQKAIQGFGVPTSPPDWVEEDDIAEWDVDPLDIENLQVVAITDGGVEFCCGGDWQNPQRLLLTPDLQIEVLDGKLEQMPEWDSAAAGEWPEWLK